METQNNVIRRYKVVSPLLLMAVVWKSVSWLLMAVKGVAFSAPEDVVMEFCRYSRGEDILGYSLAAQIWTTVKRWLLGFLIGLVTGLAVGLVCTLSRWLATLLSRWVISLPFLYAGSTKIADPKGIAVVIDGYDLLSGFLVMPTGLIYPSSKLL